jgi:hypothetical protein
LIDTAGFYSPLVSVFEHLYAAGFARDEYRDLYAICSSVDEAVRYVDEYEPPSLGDKWR